MMTSQILKFVGFTKTKKSRYFENETLFFLQIKTIHLLHVKNYFMAKNTLVAEVNFNTKQFLEILKIEFFKLKK